MNENKFEQIFETLRTDITTMKPDIAWIKGKLEGRAETRHVILTTISIVAAIAAVIVAILNKKGKIKWMLEQLKTEYEHYTSL